MVKAKKDHLSSNIILNLIYQIFLILTPLLTAPYIARTLGASGVGIYSYSNSLVTYFTVFAALGTVSYGTREIARSRENKDEYSKKFWEIELITIATSVFALVGWLVLALLYKEYKIYLLILSFQIAAICLDISWLYAGLEKFKYTISINSLTKIIGIVLIFLFVKSSDDVALYVLIMASTHFAGNASMWLFLPKVIAKQKISFDSMKQHFKGTMVFFIPSIAVTLYAIIDKTLIGLLITGTTTQVIDGTEVVVKNSNVENGYYEQATSIITMIKTVCFVAINAVLSSRVSFLFKKGETAIIQSTVKRAMNFTLFLSVGACFGIIAISRVFVPLFFGPGYEKTAILIVVLAPIVPILCVSSVLGTLYYTPAGKRKQTSYYVIIGMIINLVVSIPLVLLLKSVGAAIASLFAELIITILYFLHCNRIIGFRWFTKILVFKLLSGIIMGVSIYFLIGQLVKYLNEFYSVVISVAIGIIIYVLLLIIFRDDNISYLLKVLRLRKKK